MSEVNTQVLTKRIKDLNVTNTEIKSGTNSALGIEEDKHAEDAERLALELKTLRYVFSKKETPRGKFVMEPLSCIPYNPDSKFYAQKGIKTENDQWWSRLCYEYAIDDTTIKGDVLPLFGCYLDLNARTSSKLENYGSDIVNIYIPLPVASMLTKAIKDLTGHLKS